MSDFGRSFIDMLGNDSVVQLTREVNLRLNHKDPSTAIGEVFYGLPKNSAVVDHRVTGSDWVKPANGEFGDIDQICLISSTEIPEKLENHLVWFYSKVDPQVVLCNKYDSDHGDFVGVRFKVVENGKIFTFQQYREIDSGVTNEVDPEDGQITWDEFWDIQRELFGLATRDLANQFSFARKYFFS